jgi:hypothetical protein
MSIQLLITMRQDLAKRFAKDRSAFDVDSITGVARSARLIGPPGYSMRVSVDETEVGQLRGALEALFRVEPDYVLETFSARAPRKRGVVGRR